MRRLTALLAAALLLLACTAEQMYSTRFPCSFVFYTKYHLTSALTLSLNNPGQLVIVSPKLQQGVMHLVVVPCDGAPQETIPLGTEKESQRLRYDNMGANGRLVIGCSQFDGLKAYDGQCPNCIRLLNRTNFPLSWDESGHMLKCGKCNRVYNPNAEGMPVSGHQDGDEPLMQYRIDFNGEQIHVHN